MTQEDITEEIISQIQMIAPEVERGDILGLPHYREPYTAEVFLEFIDGQVCS